MCSEVAAVGLADRKGELPNGKLQRGTLRQMSATYTFRAMHDRWGGESKSAGTFGDEDPLPVLRIGSLLRSRGMAGISTTRGACFSSSGEERAVVDAGFVTAEPQSVVYSVKCHHKEF